MAVNIKHNLFVDMPIITFKENGSFVSYVPFLFITGIGKTHDESVKEIACTFNEMDEAFAENYN